MDCEYSLHLQQSEQHAKSNADGQANHRKLVYGLLSARQSYHNYLHYLDLAGEPGFSLSFTTKKYIIQEHECMGQVDTT